MDTKAVGEKLVALCKEGKNLDAVEQLYSNEIVSIEPQGMPDMPAEQRGLDAIRGKHRWWYENNEVHSGTTEGPFVHGDKFAAIHAYDVTSKAGPNAGNRNSFREVAVYTVKDGKIVREEFFY